MRRARVIRLAMAAALIGICPGWTAEPRTESEWIAASVVRDIAGLAAAAARKQTNTPGDVAVRLVANGDVLAVEVDGKPAAAISHVWDASGYAAFAATAFRDTRPGTGKYESKDLLDELQDLDPAAIARANAAVSSGLAANLKDPRAHEDAALLHGALVLREYAGRFRDPRHSLSRMTAHLAIARALRGGKGRSPAGQLAHGILLQTAGRGREALAQLEAAKLPAAAGPWVRALRTRLRRDWRQPGDDAQTLMETLSTAAAALRCSDGQATPGVLEEARAPATASRCDWHRILLEDPPSRPFVLLHLEKALQRESAELQAVWRVYKRGALKPAHMIAALNALPGPCVRRIGGAGPELDVIDWGTWAAFMQRHLCHIFSFVLSRNVLDRRFSNLRLYPFVVLQHHRTSRGVRRVFLQQAIAVAAAAPGQVNALNWIHLHNLLQQALQPRFDPLAIQPLSPYGAAAWQDLPLLGVPPKVQDLAAAARPPERWFVGAVPAGTAHDAPVRARLAAADIEAWLALDPCEPNLIRRSLLSAAAPTRTLAELDQAYRPATVCNLHVMRDLLEHRHLSAADRAVLIGRLAAIDPVAHVRHGELLLAAGKEKEAAIAFGKAALTRQGAQNLGPYAAWLQTYYVRIGKPNLVPALIKQVHGAKSLSGAAATALLFEEMKKPVQAEKIYRNLHKVRREYCELLNFYVRRGRLQGEHDNDKIVWAILNQILRDPRMPEAERKTARAVADAIIFPGGRRKLNPKRGRRPSRGVLVAAVGDRARHFGVIPGAVVMSVNGIEVLDLYQYTFLRIRHVGTLVPMLIWQDGKARTMRINLTHWDAGAKLTSWRAKMEDPAAVAAKRIKAVRAGGGPVKQLDLTALGLTAIPADVLALQSLERLDLSDNRLTAIPGAIAGLSNLRELTLSRNQIRQLPPELGKLHSLQKLDLDYNELPAVPAAIGGLAHLESLNLKGNRLRTLPADFGKLQQLKFLNLHDNRIEDLPPEFTALRELRLLTLAKNGLQTVPGAVWKLPNLERLALSINGLTTLPDAVGGLTRLRDLDLRANRLQTVPAALGQAAALQRLRLGQNRLEQVPPTVMQLRELHELDLSGNFLQDLPDDFVKLGKLRVLAIDNNHFRRLPEAPLTALSAHHLKVVYYGRNPVDGSAVMRLAGKMKKTRLRNESYD